MNRTQIRAAAAVTALGIGIAGTLAVRAFFDRPGESALRFMSADADAVFIEDLVPAPNQVLAFQRIQRALIRHGMKDGAVNVLAAELQEDQLSKAIGKYLGRSLALELKNDPSAKATGSPLPGIAGICFVSLTDPGAAKAALQSSLKTTASGEAYALDDGKFVRVADGYLEIASSTKWFAKADAVAAGTAKGLLASARFSAARELADRGANIKLYAKNPSTNTWGVVSGSVDDGGLRLDVRGERGWASNSKSPIDVKPIGAGTLRSVPSGAYMLFALAQPGEWSKTASKGLGKHGKSLESALRGDFVLGLYPSQKPWAGADLFLMFGSNHAATPREEFRTAIHEMQKGFNHGAAIFGRPVRYGGALIYGPSAGTKKQIASIFRSAPPGVRGDVLFGRKTLAYATRGEAVYVSTSMDLLKRAVGAANGAGSSVRDDPDFRPFSRAAAEGNQFMLAIDFRRVITGILNTASAGNQDAESAANDIRIVTNGDHILNLNAGVGMSGWVHGHVFIPLDYGRLAKILAESHD